MGCDIHLAAEVYDTKTNTWLLVPPSFFRSIKHKALPGHTYGTVEKFNITKYKLIEDARKYVSVHASQRAAWKEQQSAIKSGIEVKPAEEIEYPYVFCGAPRNYMLFGILSNVRDVAPEDGPICIPEYPEDASIQVRENLEEDRNLHSPGYFTLEQFKSHPCLKSDIQMFVRTGLENVIRYGRFVNGIVSRDSLTPIEIVLALLKAKGNHVDLTCISKRLSKKILNLWLKNNSLMPSVDSNRPIVGVYIYTSVKNFIKIDTWLADLMHEFDKVCSVQKIKKEHFRFIVAYDN